MFKLLWIRSTSSHYGHGTFPPRLLQLGVNPRLLFMNHVRHHTNSLILFFYVLSLSLSLCVCVCVCACVCPVSLSYLIRTHPKKISFLFIFLFLLGYEWHISNGGSFTIFLLVFVTCFDNNFIFISNKV